MKKRNQTLLLFFFLLPLLVIGQKKHSTTRNTLSNMIKVQGGEFLMGCSSTEEECYPDEQPPHKVCIKTFYLCAYEVTVKEYKKFCTATGRVFPRPAGWSFDEDKPMTFVSWDDANDYALWAGGRLPTEAEWEWAARGGTKSKGYIYSGSNSWDSVGWFYENSEGNIHPIGQKKPNELGLYDMSGNAWEWVSDNYAIFYYKDSPKDNPQGPKTGIGKSNRGGGYSFDYRLGRTTHRRGSGANAIGSGTGFRIAKSL